MGKGHSIFQPGDAQWQAYQHGLEVIAQHREETDYPIEKAAETPEQLEARIKQLHIDTQRAHAQGGNGHG
jgi:hypothetical protein